MRPLPSPKVVDEWQSSLDEAEIRLRFLVSWQAAIAAGSGPIEEVGPSNRLFKLSRPALEK
jgi:hypothetical protein